ncbi:hypothetical protein DXA96_13895 [Lachnospiraceae bacterium OF09-33XD]|nr:hypothetical protein DXA96_13895 [Lachnospiraceae bacterium OF09-33XD]
MQIIKEIYLDFYQTEPVLVTAKQGDNARFVKATLLDHGNLFSIPDGTTANLARGEVWNACIVNTDGTVLAPITPDMRPGRLPAEIELYLGTEKLSTWNFTLMIQPSARNDSAIEGTNEYTQLDILVNQAREEISNAQTATESANAAALNANESAALANTAASNANVAASSAETNADLAMKAAISALDGKEAATSAATSANAAADRANEAAGNIEQENIKPLAYSVSGESITAGNSAEKPLIGLTVHGRAEQVSTTGAQLFNKSTVTPESYVRDTDGTVVASTTHPTCASDYITLDGAESIYITSTMTSNRWGAFYNDKKEYVSGIAGYSSPITVPVGAVYIRLTVADDNLDTFMVNTGSTALPYEPYTYGVPSPSVEYPQAIDIAGSGGSINVKVVGANLFDISKVQSISGASGSQTTNNNDGTLLVQSSQGDSSGGYEDGKNVLRDLCPELRAGDIAVLSAKSTGSDKRIYLRGSKSPWTFGASRTISETDLDSIVMFYASGTSTSATISEIMINAGSVALPYEPYKTPQSVSLSTPNGLAGLKVSSGGNYTDASGQQWRCDEIVRNERGTGKRIQRIGIIESYASETINTAYMSTTGQLTEGATVLYVLDDVVETDLSAEEIAALSALHTYSPTTTISNDAGCDMTAAYVTQYYQGVGDAMFYGVADNLTTEASGTSVLDAHQGKVLDNKIGALNDLETTAKSSAVAAINEIKSDVSLLSDKTTVTVLNPILKKTISYATGGTQESVFVATEACTVFTFASAEVEGAVSGRAQIKFDKDGEFDSRGLGQFSSGDQYPALSISGVFHLTAGDRLLFSVWCSEAFTMNYINVNLCIVPDH